MNPRVRRIIFICFIAVFFISAPLVILYTMGYRYDWTRGRLFQTGVITVESEPRGADVWIDGVALDRKTPVRINNLLPGAYTIRIHKDGWLDWTEEVVVRSRQATILGEIPLLPDSVPQLVTNQPVLSALPNPENNSWLYFTQTDGQKRLHEVRITDGAVTDWPFAFSADATLISEVRFHSVVVQSSADGAVRYDVLRLRDATLNPLPEPQGQLTWLSEDELLASNGTTVCNLFISSQTQLCQPFLTLQFWSADNQLYYTVAEPETTTLYQADSPWSGEGQIIGRLPQSDSYTLLADRPDTLILIDTKTQDLFVIDRQAKETSLRHLTGAAKDASWDANQEALLYYNDFEVWLWDIETDNRRLITRVSQPIEQVRWLPNKQYLLFSQAQQLSALELWTGRHATYPLAQNHVGYFGLDQAGTGTIYISTNEEKSTLWRRTLQ